MDGEGSNLLFKGAIDELAPQITLPYMVGASVLWTITAVKLIDLLINMTCVLAAHRLFGSFEARGQTTLTIYIAVLMRIVAMFIGVISVGMIVRGLTELLLAASYAVGIMRGG